MTENEKMKKGIQSWWIMFITYSAGVGAVALNGMKYAVAEGGVLLAVVLLLTAFWLGTSDD